MKYLNNVKYIVPVTGKVSYENIYLSCEITSVKEPLIRHERKDKVYMIVDTIKKQHLKENVAIVNKALSS